MCHKDLFIGKKKKNKLLAGSLKSWVNAEDVESRLKEQHCFAWEAGNTYKLPQLVHGEGYCSVKHQPGVNAPSAVPHSLEKL